MQYPLELELRQYRQAVVNGLSSSTRQQALMLSRQGDGLSELIGGLNFIGSGLAGVESSLDVIGADLARLATSVDSALPSIVEYLAISAKEITDISKMMATPEETRASERFRTGTMALAKAQKAGSPTRIQEWHDLAVRDLREAVGIHKYHAKSWFNLGIALGRLGRNDEAAEAFASSAFFGVDQSLEFGATAVLLAAGLYRQADLVDKSAEILHEYLNQLDRCAEIHLALAMHHGAPGELRRALELCPVLALDARQADLPEVEAVAGDLCLRPGGVHSQLRQLRKAIQALVKARMVAGIPQVEPITPANTGSLSKVDTLLLTTAMRLTSLDIARQLMAEVKSGILQLHNGFMVADRYVVQAKEDASKRVSAAFTYESERIARMREDGITRANSTQSAALRKYGLRNIVYEAERRAARANYERVMREVNAACEAEEKFLGTNLLRWRQEAERVGAEAQALADAALAKFQHATAVVAEPLGNLAALTQDANIYSGRIVPFKLQDFWQAETARNV